MMKAFALEPEVAEKLDAGEYYVELKIDGSRDMWVRDTLLSMRNVNHNMRYAHIYNVLKMLVDMEIILDGEIALPDSNVLELNKKSNWSKAIFYVFDVLKYNGEDCRQLPLVERRGIIEEIVHELNSPFVMLVPRFENFKEGWEFVCSNNLEGLVLKKKISSYSGNVFDESRSRDWFKVKLLKETVRRVIGFEKGSQKGAFILEDGGKVSSLVSGTEQIYESNKNDIYAEIMFQFLTSEGKPFQPRLKRLITKENKVLWESG